MCLHEQSTNLIDTHTLTGRLLATIPAEDSYGFSGEDRPLAPFCSQWLEAINSQPIPRDCDTVEQRGGCLGTPNRRGRCRYAAPSSARLGRRTLRPTPTTSHSTKSASAEDSTRTPATLRSSSQTSLGHLSPAERRRASRAPTHAEAHRQRQRGDPRGRHLWAEQHGHVQPTCGRGPLPAETPSARRLSARKKNGAVSGSVSCRALRSSLVEAVSSTKATSAQSPDSSRGTTSAASGRSGRDIRR